MRKINLLLKNKKKSSFFYEFKTLSKFFFISEDPKKICFCKKTHKGSTKLQKVNIGIINIGTSVPRIKVKCASEVKGCCLPQL